MTNGILYEKYRPKKLADYIGNEKVIDDLKQWLNDYYNKDNKKTIHPNVILIGGPGIGKTTLANIILNEFGFDVLEFNASDTRNSEHIDDIFKGILQQNNNNICHLLLQTKKRIAVVMDEIDGLSVGDKSGFKRLQYYLAENKYICPVILTSNISQYTASSNKKLNEIKKNCTTFHLDTPPQHIFYNYIDDIVKKEDMIEYISPAFINILIKNSQGDFRYIFNTLDMMRILFKSKSLELTEMIDYIKSNAKDISYDLYQSTEKIYNSKINNIEDVFTLFELDRYSLPIYVFDNLYQYLNNFPMENIKIICKILENYVHSIYFENALYNELEWEYFDHHCVCTILTVNILNKYIKNKSTSKTKNSRLLSKINSINANTETRLKISKNYNMNSENYHLYLELLVKKIISEPTQFKTILETYDITKEELLRMIKSSDCKEVVLPQLKDIGIITSKECERIS